jgi:melibiose permease
MMVLYPLLRKKLSNERLFIVSFVLAICGYAVILLLCLAGLASSLVLLCVPGALVFLANGILSVLTTVFLSSSVDYGQLKTGRREESVIFSMQTFVVKAASGLAVFLTGVGLDLIGLVGNTDETGPVAVQSAQTLLGLRLMMTLLPIAGLVVGLLVFRKKFLLTDAYVEQLHATLHASGDQEQGHE